MNEVISRFGLMDALMGLAREGAALEASVVTTFSLNAMFYEEVLLRAFERAGSRLNVLLVDANQLAAALDDPLRRPRRAGRDYLLVPVDAGGAFHPKFVVLLSSKKPLIAVGSHNVTDCGYARNDEVTVCWGHGSRGVPTALLSSCLDFTIDWLRRSPGLREMADEVSRRLTRLGEDAAKADSASASFLGWRRGGPTLLDQLDVLLRGVVQRAWVVAPYFDTDLHFLNELVARWRPREIVVGIQQHSALLLKPDLALPPIRFVDISAVDATDADAGRHRSSFMHAKMLAVETDQGLFVALGSPNASASAWMQDRGGNAEAAILLEDALARQAFEGLGLARLTDAPSLTPETLAEIAERSAKTRLQEEIEKSVAPVATIAASATARGWFLPGLPSAVCRRAFVIGDLEVALPGATFIPAEDGTELLPSATPLRAGSCGSMATTVH